MNKLGRWSPKDYLCQIIFKFGQIVFNKIFSPIYSNKEMTLFTCFFLLPWQPAALKMELKFCNNFEKGHPSMKFGGMPPTHVHVVVSCLKEIADRERMP